MSLRSRLAKLEARIAGAADGGGFTGSPRFWAAMHRPCAVAVADLSDAERDQLARLFFPAADLPDPVEDAIAAMEARARPHVAGVGRG